MSNQIQSLLDSLAEHGTIDSTGQFTVDVERASRLLPSHQTSDSNLFLAAMVSAGFRAGAGRIQLSVNNSSTKLTATFENMEIDLSSLQVYEAQSQSVGDPILLDLSLGIREALTCGAKSVTVEVPCEMLAIGSRVSKLTAVAADEGMESGTVGVLVQFPRKFWKGSDYRPLAAPIELLRPLARWSRRPLELGGIDLRDPFAFPDPQYLVQVGEFDPSRLPYRADFQLEEKLWSAVLCLGAGEIELVDAGIHRGTISNSFFHGVLYHPDFRLDASRERVIENSTLHAVYQELEELRTSVLSDICERLGKEPKRDAWLLDQVWLPSLVGEIETKHQEKLSTWFYETLSNYGLFLGEPELDITERLFWQGVKLSDARYQGWTVEHIQLLRIAQRVLQEDLSGQEPVIRGVLKVLEKQRPKQTLIRAYLLLGLGATYQRAGETKVAERVWLEAVKQVAGRRHREQEMLIRAHLEYGLEHILEETATLLEMQIQALENDEWL